MNRSSSYRGITLHGRGDLDKNGTGVDERRGAENEEYVYVLTGFVLQNNKSHNICIG